MRHRQQETPQLTVPLYSYPTTSAGGGLYYWDMIGGTELVKTVTEGIYRKTEMFDEVHTSSVRLGSRLGHEFSLMPSGYKKYKPAQKCCPVNENYHDSRDGDYRFYLPGPVGRPVWDYFTDSTPLSTRYKDYPITRIIMDSNIYENAFLWPAKKLEQLLGSPSLPTGIDIKKDPFDTDFSVWYLLVDLIDLYKLAGRLDKNSVKRVADALNTKVVSHKGIKSIANTNLGIQFGLLPTIQDMKEFLTLVFNWRKKYDDLYKLTHEIHNWKVPGMDISHLVHLPTHMFGKTRMSGVSETPIQARYKLVSCQFHRTANYHWAVPEFTGFLARLAQFVDAFGVYDPAAIWDVIPGSFIVDWFYNVGAWLHRVKPKFYPASVAITDYCESIRLEYIIEWYLTSLTPTSSSPVMAEPFCAQSTAFIGSERCTSYVRKRFKPPEDAVSLPALHEASFLKLRRASIAGSLYLQRIIPRTNYSKSGVIKDAFDMLIDLDKFGDYTHELRGIDLIDSIRARKKAVKRLPR